MQHPTSRALYAYWNEVRGERIAPRRFDIEPSHLGTMLAETFILECDGTQPAIFRLAGTKICDNFGREFRGTRFSDIVRDEHRAELDGHVDEMRAQGAVHVLEVATGHDDKHQARFEVLMLPLVHSGNSISRVLGVIAAVEMPSWIGGERLPLLDVVGHERIWPEGRPHLIEENHRNQTPLIPELAGARIVRSNRRSFRILDGGLHKG